MCGSVSVSVPVSRQGVAGKVNWQSQVFNACCASRWKKVLPCRLFWLSWLFWLHFACPTACRTKPWHFVSVKATRNWETRPKIEYGSLFFFFPLLFWVSLHFWFCFGFCCFKRNLNISFVMLFAFACAVTWATATPMQREATIPPSPSFPFLIPFCTHMLRAAFWLIAQDKQHRAPKKLATK